MELWASCDLQGRSRTQPQTFCNHPDTARNHRKATRNDIKIPGHLAGEKGFQILRPKAARTPCGICGAAHLLVFSVATKFKVAIGLPRRFKGIPGYPKEEGLLDYLGRLGVAGSSVEMSRLLWLLFPADFSLQEVSSRDQGDRRRLGEAQRPRTLA